MADGVINFSGKPATGPSVYERLYELCLTMEESIKQVSTDARANVETDIMRLKRDANKVNSNPEVEYATLLFKKYTEEAVGTNGGRNDDGNGLALLGDITIPAFLYEGTAEQLSGVEATKKNIFWMRCLAALFAFLCCIIMGTVPDISYRSMHPNRLFKKDCGFTVVKGDFNYDAFKLAIAVGSLVFIHSFLFAVYYVLPTDLAGHKFIPGLENLFESCFDRQQVTSTVSIGSSFCKVYSKMIEVIIDAVLLILLLITCIFAAVKVEGSNHFQVSYQPSSSTSTSTGSEILLDQYYTINSFCETYSSVDPSCMNSSDNPILKMRWALVMLFLVFFVKVFALQVSFRSFLEERKMRSGTSRQQVRTMDPGESSSHGLAVSSHANSSISLSTSNPLGGYGGTIGGGVGTGAGTGTGSGSYSDYNGVSSQPQTQSLPQSRYRDANPLTADLPGVDVEEL